MPKRKKFPIIGPIIAFIKEAYLELKKVSWPKKKDVVNMVVVVVLAIVIGALVIGAIDYGLTYGVRTLLLK